jgi:glycosyltransferase involved in cell wall biosynthesis
VDRSVFECADVLIGDAPRLVCVGRLCEQKGHLLLVHAAARLAADGIPFELVLAGDGELRNEIEALATAHGLQSRVRITGWVGGDRVREEILAARALVLPSFAEGLPVVIMEALALGRPVVTTYVAGIPELMACGETGWLVPAGDVGALVLALKEVLHAEPQALDAMGRRGRDVVLARHDAGLEASKLAGLFHEAAVRENDEGVR